MSSRRHCGSDARDAWRVRRPILLPTASGRPWRGPKTLINETHAPEDVYRETHERFTEQELVNLTIAIVAINGWNRICIGFRIIPGSLDSRAVHV